MKNRLKTFAARWRISCFRFSFCPSFDCYSCCGVVIVVVENRLWWDLWQQATHNLWHHFCAVPITAIAIICALSFGVSRVFTRYNTVSILPSIHTSFLRFDRASINLSIPQSICPSIHPFVLHSVHTWVVISYRRHSGWSSVCPSPTNSSEYVGRRMSN